MIGDEFFKITTKSPTETRALGKLFGARLAAGDVINLRGDLGAGKTVLVKGIAEGMGIDPDDVQSPTFTLVREYQEGAARLYHLDLYRLNAAEAEAEEAGVDLYLPSPDGVTAVEWGERAPELLPVPRFEATIRPAGDGGVGDRREIALYGVGVEPRRVEALVEALSAPDREGPA